MGFRLGLVKSGLSLVFFVGRKFAVFRFLGMLRFFISSSFEKSEIKFEKKILL